MDLLVNDIYIYIYIYIYLFFGACKLRVHIRGIQDIEVSKADKG